MVGRESKKGTEKKMVYSTERAILFVLRITNSLQLRWESDPLKKRNANGVARWFRACLANSEGGTDAESARENDARFCGSKALIIGLWMEKPA